MSNYFYLLPFLLLGLLLLGGMLFGGENPRLIAIRSWAQDKGWSFSADKQKNFDQRFPYFDCLNQGDDRYAHHIVEGRWGDHSFIAFDYHYATGSGKHRTSHSFSAVILDPGFPLTPLRVRRESWSDKLAGMLGFNDIDFDSAEFSNQYHVSSPDRKWAHDVLHVRTIEALLQGPGHEFQFSNNRAIVWAQQRLSTEQFEAATDLMSKVIDAIPRFAKQAASDFAAERAFAASESQPHEVLAPSLQRAVYLVVGYIVLILGALLLRKFGAPPVLQGSFSETSTEVCVAFSVYLILGLLKRRRRAWVMASVAALMQLFYLASTAYDALTLQRPIELFSFLTAALLTYFLAVLLRPDTRAAFVQ